MRKLTTKDNEMVLKDGFESIFEKKVTRFGNGAKIDCPLKYLDKKVYVIVRED